MAMKKTSGGDSPLRQGAGKSFWTLPIFGSTAAADRDVFWKSDRVFRLFPSGGPRGPTPPPLRFSGSFGEILGDWLWFRPIPRIFAV
jgi:hypothetical protein